MPTPIVIRIRQEGLVRTQGFQLVQWAVTIPDGVPPVGTFPLSFAACFRHRNVGGVESFEGAATLKDLTDFRANELSYFEVKGPGGDVVMSQAVVGDTLTFSPTALSFWLQTDAPYATNVFLVNAVATWIEGTVTGLTDDVEVLSTLDSRPVILTGNRLQLPHYAFTPEDVGRWVFLSGFVTSAYNVPVLILALDGNTATISLTTSSNETGAGWQTRRVQVQTSVGGEARYFPTLVRDVAWTLKRGSSVLASAPAGGYTRRQYVDAVSRSVRATSVLPSLDAALALKSATQAGVAALQSGATKNDADFLLETTTTYGP